MTQNKYIYYTLYALIGLTYFFGLFVHQTADAGKYAAISRTLLESGDWINLKSHGMPYDQKPPLLFWLGAISFKLFGYYNWAFKLPTLLFSALGIYSIFRLGKLLYNEATGKLAALVFVTTEMCFLYNMDIHTDALLTANVIFGIWQVMEYLKNKKWHHFVLGFVGIGLAMMSKGPIGLAVPVFAIGTHLLLHRDFKNIFNWRWILAAFILLLVISPALAGLYGQLGIEGVKFYFWTNMAGRIDGSYAGGNTDYFFYIHTMAYILLPWSIFALIALFMEFREHSLKKWKALPNDEFVTLGGSVLFLIVLSMAKGKAPHYMMIVTPLISIYTAKWILKIQESDNYPRLKKILNPIHFGSLLILWAIAFFIPTYIWPTTTWYVWLPVALAFVMFCYYFFRKKNFHHLKVTTILSVTALNIVLFTVMLPSMFDYMASVQMCKTYNAEAKDSDILYSYKCEHDEVYFYAKSESHYVHNSNQLNAILNQNTSWVYTNKEGLEEIQSSNVKLEKLYTYDHKKVSKPKFKFIWPATRQASLQQRYLVKVGNASTAQTIKRHYSRGNRDLKNIQ
ncbi:ArnT family glycosyltransferase [Marinifilum sp.]|uniref:ArnT family glycosyltransferase n=1 Tax=Marinifilum sp. TaxID=2033137 RepID=UPI003BA9DC37